MPLLLAQGYIALHTRVWRAEWAPDMVGSLWEEQSYLPLLGIELQFLDYPVHG